MNGIKKELNESAQTRKENKTILARESKHEKRPGTAGLIHKEREILFKGYRTVPRFPVYGFTFP